MSAPEPDPDGLRRAAWRGRAAVVAAVLGIVTVAALVLAATGVAHLPGDGSDEPGTTPGAAAAAIPAGFPLAAGWPGADSRGPAADLPDAEIDLAACGRPAPAPTDFGSLSAARPDGDRRRMLVALPDEGTAQAWVDDLQAFYDACSDDERQVLPTEAGGRSFAMVGRQRVLRVVQLGRAVLLDRADYDGGDDPEGEAARQLAAMDADATRVLLAMCVFTAVSC